MPEYNFEKYWPTLKAPQNDNEIGSTKFQTLLGRQKWNSLPAATKARFSERLNPAVPRVYKGYVLHTRMNLAGKFLSRLLKLIGAPLPLDSDNADHPAVVTVMGNKYDLSQYWTRQYGRPNGPPQIIQSTKKFDGPTGLEEHIGKGIGINLNLAIEDEVLLFKSQNYFIHIFGRRLYLPNWLTPGKLTVGHADHGDGWFAFSLRLVHPIFGFMIDQKAMFCDELRI